jgi:hypothetical protein
MTARSGRPIGQLLVAPRFNGPPTSANGGYVSGCLAGFLPSAGAVQVTLRQPPPLETPLTVAPTGNGVSASFGGTLIAEAMPVELSVNPVDPVSAAEAAIAARGYGGWARHPFPTCFACGTEREAPDGLGLRPGPVPGRAGVTACPWTPDHALVVGSSIPPEMVWAALDCPGGWGSGIDGRPAVLGRMAAQIDLLPAAGEPCVVMGELLRADGRKSFTATTLYDSDGRVLARAAATWFAVDPSAFG